jgi:hypothetical protein
MFYYAFKTDLKPIKPIPKFLTIKAVIFFSFWQAFVIAILVEAGVIRVSPLSSITSCVSIRVVACLHVCNKLSGRYSNEPRGPTPPRAWQLASKTFSFA